LIYGREADASLLWSLLSLIFTWYQGKGGRILKMTIDLPLVNIEAKNVRNYISTLPFAIMAYGGTSWATFTCFLSFIKLYGSNYIKSTKTSEQFHH
jgi:hypothetical protein